MTAKFYKQQNLLSFNIMLYLAACISKVQNLDVSDKTGIGSSDDWSNFQYCEGKYIRFEKQTTSTVSFAVYSSTDIVLFLWNDYDGESWRYPVINKKETAQWENCTILFKDDKINISTNGQVLMESKLDFIPQRLAMQGSDTTLWLIPHSWINDTWGLSCNSKHECEKCDDSTEESPSNWNMAMLTVIIIIIIIGSVIILTVRGQRRRR